MIPFAMNAGISGEYMMATLCSFFLSCGKSFFGTRHVLNVLSKFQVHITSLEAILNYEGALLKVGLVNCCSLCVG